MRKYKSLLALVLVFLLLIGNINVQAEEEEKSLQTSERTVAEDGTLEGPPGRQWITGEDLGTAVVVDGRLRTAVGSNCVITPGAVYNYGTWTTNMFTVATDTGSHMGFCAQPTQPTPSGTYKVSKLKNDTIKALVLFYIVPPLYQQIGKNLYGTTEENYAYCHAAIGYVYSGLLTGLSTDQADWVLHMVEDTQEILAGTHQNPKTTELLNQYINKYELYVAYNNSQDIVWVETIEEGKLKLNKKSANLDITDGNRCYGLEGAVYGIYSDSACKTKVGTLTTTADGNSNEVSLSVGTYYVKEITAPSGYALDSKVYTVEIKAEQTAEVMVLEVKDVPQSDRAELFLAKTDAETGKNEPQGSGTLENAQFTIKYYDGYYDETPVNKSPLRTWVVKTDAQGYCYLDDGYKVSGDEFYHDLSGNVVLPLGTIIIQETKAPDGYLINETVYVRKITAEGTTERISTYNNPVVPENILRLVIQKSEQGTNHILGGVVFQHTMPDGTTENITTDEEFGEGVINGLTEGVHVIKEIDTLDGYMINPGEVRFEVLENGEIKLLANTASEDTGMIMFYAEGKGCALLEVDNAVVPFTLSVHKENESKKALAGAEFTIYSDADCKQAVSAGITDSQGNLKFSGLKNDTDYYLKETKAPQGYRVPVNADGSSLVYKVRVKNSPASGTFTYYINEKEYTAQDAAYKVTGTKNDPVVNLTVINYTGVQMPETGTNKTLVMSVLGLGCVSAAALYMMNRRKNEGR